MDDPLRFLPLRALVLTVALVLSACASVPDPQPCALPESDRAWVDRAFEAWRFTSREITGIGVVPDFEAVIFGENCVLSSVNALYSTERASWTASPHAGTIKLPDGSEMPAGVTSFVSGDEGLRYLAMSTPSVWQAAGVGEGPRLATMMIAVLLHEGSHVAQIGPYGARLEELIDRYDLPDSFNDDAVQERFEGNDEFAASVKEETRLFLAAAASEDDAGARTLAAQARRLMLDRQEKWFVGDDQYLAEAEDIWLTFEGAGQWTGYQWLVHPQSGAAAPVDLLERFTSGRRWSQTEGFAVVMALDRIAGPEWKRHAYGDGERTVLEMLDDSLEINVSLSF